MEVYLSHKLKELYFEEEYIIVIFTELNYNDDFRKH
jgi:hypothetical protein